MQSHQTLRVILYILSALEGIAGVVLLFATPWVLSFEPHILALPYTSYVIALVKGIGILALALGYLLCVTARDPVRYVAIVDALVFICIAAAALNVYSVVSLHLGVFYPPAYLLARAAVQALAGMVLFALRPREIRSTQAA